MQTFSQVKLLFHVQCLREHPDSQTHNIFHRFGISCKTERRKKVVEAQEMNLELKSYVRWITIDRFAPERLAVITDTFAANTWTWHVKMTVRDDVAKVIDTIFLQSSFTWKQRTKREQKAIINNLRALTNRTKKQTKWKQKKQRLVDLSHHNLLLIQITKFSPFEQQIRTFTFSQSWNRVKSPTVCAGKFARISAAESDCYITWTLARWEMLARHQDKLLQNVASQCNMNRARKPMKSISTSRISVEIRFDVILQTFWRPAAEIVPGNSTSSTPPSNQTNSNQ